MKIFEDVPVGTLFARRGYPPVARKPHEVYIKMREPYRWYVPDGSGYMNVNAIEIRDGSRHSINLGESVKRVGLLLGLRTLFAALRRKQ